MSDLITNPIFLLIAVIVLIVIIIAIINNSLTSKKKKIYRTIDNNRDYLESQARKYNETLDVLLNKYITDETITNELAKVKDAIDIDNNLSIDHLIEVENTMYDFINNPMIKAEEYEDINDTLTKLYNENLTEILKKERNAYNVESTSYNTKLEDFPTSLISSMFHYTKVPIFNDSVVKATSTLNNSASYLSSNYQINQDTVKSPEAVKNTEGANNLYLAKQVKGEEEKAVVIDAASVANLPTPQTQVNQNFSFEESPTLTSASPSDTNILTNAPTEPIEVEVSNDSTPSSQLETPIEIATEETQVAEPTITENIPGESQVEEHDIELVNPIANSFTEPISINESTPLAEQHPENNSMDFDVNNSISLDGPISIDTNPEPISLVEETPSSSLEPESSVTISPLDVVEVSQESSPQIEESPGVDNFITPEDQAEPSSTQPERYCPNCHQYTNEEYCPECGYPTE